MKYIISFLLLLISYFGVCAQTTNDNLVQAGVVVDGLFFDKFSKSLLPGGATISLLADSEGNKVMAIYLPEGYILDDSIKAKAIPSEQIKYADKLLRDFNGRKPDKIAKYTGIGVKVGEPFIKFEYSDIDNKVWNNKKLKDKVYVINIWQSECGPCRREMPILSKWKEQFPDVVFLSASRHNKEEILPIAHRHNFTWIHLQEASDIVALVGQQGFPLTIVVDKKGIVRFAKVGASAQNQAEALATIKDIIN